MQFSLVLLLLAAVRCSVFGDEEFRSGFISLGPSRHNVEIYYILFKARTQNPRAPLIWFFEGGPGQSSMHGLFYQNGPFRLNKDHLEKNAFSFNNIADVLYVDQPIGTGFSNCSNTSWIPHNESLIVEDLMIFLDNFLRIYPDYHRRATYIYTQGYGSHFALPLARNIFNGFVPLANIQGIALGNPLIRPELQMASISSFSKTRNLISEFKYIASLYGYIIASVFIDLDLDVAAYDLIQVAHGIIIGARNHAFNRLDIRMKCLQGPCVYNFSDLNRFVDKPEVRSAMETGQRHFNYTSREVFYWLLLKNEYLADTSDSLVYMLDKTTVPIYIFTGENDWLYNVMGMDEVVDSLYWSGREEMRKAHWDNWYSDGQLEGLYRRHKGLYHVHVLNAGHYVGMDLPWFTLDLMTRLMYGSRD